MARLKSPAQAVPQSLSEADALAVELGELLRMLDQEQAAISTHVARLQLASKTVTDPIAKAIDAKFKALSTWASGHRSEIVQGDRKSRQIAAGTIGFRLSNPKVVIAAGMEEAVIEFLSEFAPHLLQETVTISKAAILADRKIVDEIDHVEIFQGEEFFFRPLAIDLEKARAIGPAPAAVQDAA